MVSSPITMKPILVLILGLVIVSSPGCSDSKKETEKAQADAAAKARADAAKKEMETLPKVFRSRDIFEKNEPAKTQPNPSVSAPQQKS
jgi:hypothetical protein